MHFRCVLIMTKHDTEADKHQVTAEGTWREGSTSWWEAIAIKRAGAIKDLERQLADLTTIHGSVLKQALEQKERVAGALDKANHLANDPSSFPGYWTINQTRLLAELLKLLRGEPAVEGVIAIVIKFIDDMDQCTDTARLRLLDRFVKDVKALLNVDRASIVHDWDMIEPLVHEGGDINVIRALDRLHFYFGHPRPVARPQKG